MKSVACLTMVFFCAVSFTAAQHDAFAAISHDSVVAYNFGLSRTVRTILEPDSSLNRTTRLPGVTLTSDQSKKILRIVNDKKTYGGAPFACFEPKHAVIFYSKGKVRALIEICFECNTLASSPAIEAKDYYYLRKQMTIQNYGFSDKGRDKLISFFLGIGLIGGLPKDH